MNSKRGVTLVELLIVVLILGALAAIAIPRLSQSADTAKKNACKTNIDLINSQIELYTYQLDDLFPGWPAPVSSDRCELSDRTGQQQA
jgi:prepilin-type N-terminal cleavage/methylation domain-containing protein